jgi:ATP-binding cassette subfamily A (ABC1) protein 3
LKQQFKISDKQELMKMMGLKTWILWLSWMVNTILVNVITVTIITVLLKVPFGDTAILPYSDFALVWIMLLFYCIAGITFCFAVGSLFSRRKYSRAIQFDCFS